MIQTSMCFGMTIQIRQKSKRFIKLITGVCVCWWSLRWEGLEKLLSHCSQAYGPGVPSWIVFLCQFKLDKLPKDLFHWSQLNVFDCRFDWFPVGSLPIEQSERVSFAPAAAATTADSHLMANTDERIGVVDICWFEWLIVSWLELPARF